jgi:hypothetical protein
VTGGLFDGFAVCVYETQLGWTCDGWGMRSGCGGRRYAANSHIPHPRYIPTHIDTHYHGALLLLPAVGEVDVTAVSPELLLVTEYSQRGDTVSYVPALSLDISGWKD